MMKSAYREIQSRIMQLASDDDGMSTAEYAIGTVAAAAFGAVLYGVVTESQVILF